MMTLINTILPTRTRILLNTTLPTRTSKKHPNKPLLRTAHSSALTSLDERCDGGEPSVRGACLGHALSCGRRKETHDIISGCMCVPSLRLCPCRLFVFLFICVFVCAFLVSLFLLMSSFFVSLLVFLFSDLNDWLTVCLSVYKNENKLSDPQHI